MTSSVERLASLLHLGLLRTASMALPRSQRAEWWREWHSELWQVRNAFTPDGDWSWQGELKVISFCLGAFQDAFCLLRQFRPVRMRLSPLTGSPGQCIFHLAVLLTASYLLALSLPGVQAELSLVSSRIGPGLVLIRYADLSSNSIPSIAPRQYRGWKGHKQRYFDEFAFYRVTRETLSGTAAPAGLRATSRWDVGHASANFFALLGLPVLFSQPHSSHDGDLPRMVLSEEAWKREFRAEPGVAGRVVSLGLRQVRIVGVVPDRLWGLPGKVDAWLLQPDSDFVSSQPGYLVAHLSPYGEVKIQAEITPITASRPDLTTEDLLSVPLTQAAPGSWAAFLFACLVAFLALPAITPLSFSDYSVQLHKPSWPARLYSWVFLSAKISLILPIAYFASLDLAYGRAAVAPITAVYIQLAASFSICLFGLCWALHDQRQRCPMCLRRVAHPAHVGLPSRTFLAWNGTELICPSGHSLLHVPELPTSWFSTQRWLFLDPSWQFLFAGSGAKSRAG